MNTTTFLAGKAPDATILEIFDAVSEKYGMERKSVQYTNITLSDKEIETIREKKGPTHLLTRFEIKTRQNPLTLIIERNLDDPSRMYYDTVKITPSGDPKPTALQLIDFVDFVKSKLRFPVLDIPPGSEKNVLEVLEKEVASLASLHQQMVGDAIDLRKKLETEHAERATALENERIEKERQIREKEEESLSRIEAEKRVLDERLRDFDISDHMRARRKQRDEISNQVQNFLRAPQSSISTRVKFSVLSGAIIAISAATGFFAYETFNEFYAATTIVSTTSPQDTVQNRSFLLWGLGIRGALLTAVCIGFGVYLVNLIRKSHDDEVRYQRELQRYGMDINRASWVIETAMEMTTKEGATLPERWVYGVTNGLFSYDKKPEETSSLSALGALMSLGPKVSIGPNGTSVEVSGSSTKRASKDAD